MFSPMVLRISGESYSTLRLQSAKDLLYSLQPQERGRCRLLTMILSTTYKVSPRSLAAGAFPYVVQHWFASASLAEEGRRSSPVNVEIVQ